MAAGDVQIGPAMRAPSLVDAIVPSVILAVLIAGSLVAKAWERAQEAAAGAKKEADDYIRQAAGAGAGNRRRQGAFGSRDHHPGRVRIAEGQIAQLAAQNGRQDSTKGERSSTTANRRERNHLPHN